MSNNAENQRYYDLVKFGFAMKRKSLENMSCNIDAEKKQKLGEIVGTLNSMLTLGMSHHMYMKTRLNLETLENAKNLHKFIYETDTIKVSIEDDSGESEPEMGGNLSPRRSRRVRVVPESPQLSI
ncbi:hypothetical protein G6F42_010580 [Rhizopus arrhizus]|nr:hypothetical protein G6F42_010580 [Rhizopus arrhizus]